MTRLPAAPFSPIAMTLLSPIFDTTTTYTQGGVNVGTTQYVDAFQRGNFWSIVQNNPTITFCWAAPPRTSPCCLS